MKMAFIMVQPNAAFLNMNMRKQREFGEFMPQYTEKEMYTRFRFSEDSINYICNVIQEDLVRKTKRNHALSVKQQVLITLRFLASGSFLQVIGDTVGVDKSTVSRVVNDVCEALVLRRSQFIRWPANEEEKNSIKEGFMTYGRFPNVLGCIDCTHVRIQAPTRDEPAYVNRKGWHSINVQAVCDHQGKFTNIFANWPGSAHDSHIFRTSNLCQHLEQHHRGIVDGFLIGDSGYPCRPFLLTPFGNPTGNAQDGFNTSLCRTRVTIERAFGILKRRFHVLHSEIRMKPEKVCKVVIACAVLHNIAIDRREALQNDDAVHRQMQPVLQQYGGRNDGKLIRDHVASTYFAH